MKLGGRMGHGTKRKSLQFGEDPGILFFPFTFLTFLQISLIHGSWCEKKIWHRGLISIECLNCVAAWLNSMGLLGPGGGRNRLYSKTFSFFYHLVLWHLFFYFLSIGLLYCIVSSWLIHIKYLTTSMSRWPKTFHAVHFSQTPVELTLWPLGGGNTLKRFQQSENNLPHLSYFSLGAGAALGLSIMVSSNLCSVPSAPLPLISALYPLSPLYGLVERSQKSLPHLVSGGRQTFPFGY